MRAVFVVLREVRPQRAGAVRRDGLDQVKQVDKESHRAIVACSGSVTQP